MNLWDLFPVVLLMVLGVALVFGSGILLANRRLKLATRTGLKATGPAKVRVQREPPPSPASYIQRPGSWLAIRSRNLAAVQRALGLQNAKPCTWTKGLSGEEEVFVAPPVGGWILVMGSRLPDPAEDVDVCYRCLQELSRKLGHVQFFAALRVLGHHAWVRTESGRVLRAYAWAGKTLWNQGQKTRAELELDMRCYSYLEGPESTFSGGMGDVIAMNTEKVPLLAARWSFDPATVDEHNFEQVCGVAGEPSRLY